MTREDWRVHSLLVASKNRKYFPKIHCGAFCWYRLVLLTIWFRIQRTCLEPIFASKVDNFQLHTLLNINSTKTCSVKKEYQKCDKRACVGSCLLLSNNNHCFYSPTSSSSQSKSHISYFAVCTAIADCITNADNKFQAPARTCKRLANSATLALSAAFLMSFPNKICCYVKLFRHWWQRPMFFRSEVDKMVRFSSRARQFDSSDFLAKLVAWAGLNYVSCMWSADNCFRFFVMK